MKIADYALTLQSSHSWSQQSSVTETLRVSAAPPPPPAAQQLVSLSPAGLDKQAGEAAAINQAVNDAQNDPKIQLLIQMIERLTGQKVKLVHIGQAVQPASAPPPPSSPGYNVEYSKTVSYSESEQTAMQASGTVKTSDGKEINFTLNLAMQRQYSVTSSTSVSTAPAQRKTDPLVINFNGTAAQLSDQRFAFDLNSDGKTEQINAPTAGSGFLALDLNNDGKINNGSELFGPASGNGFSQLAQYDVDHNGWIDENDPVFQKLKVWTRDAAGNDKLSSLAASGVGAISLQAIATPFDIKTATNQLLGTVRSSSVALNENGSVASVQQIDLTA